MKSGAWEGCMVTAPGSRAERDTRPHRSTGRRTPQEAYTALPIATPIAHQHSEWRTRTDKVDKRGAISIRYAGKLRHLGIGRAHAGTPVLILIRNHDVSISDANTGEIIAEHTIDTTRDYQPRKQQSRQR